MIYDKNWQNLSLDWNGNPVMGWLTEAWEIRQVRVNEAGWLIVAPITNNPSATGALICWQVKITTTGTAVGLPTANVWQLVVLSAYENNVWPITVWVSTWVTNVINWTGNGFILAPWAIIPVVVDNLNKIFINWTENDIVSYSLT